MSKIVTLEELLGLIENERPRVQKVAMAHGCFQLVHPGHHRHLNYAKSKVDILIVSITADRFINKGVYSPHIPQRLRAEGLAALEIVDYVVIDDNATPLENILKIKPDYFCK